MRKGKGTWTKVERKSKQFWQEQIDRWKGKGVPIRQYCRENGVSTSGFYYWKQKLGSNSGGGIRSAFVPSVRDANQPRCPDHLAIAANVAQAEGPSVSELSFVPVRLGRRQEYNNNDASTCRTGSTSQHSNQLELITPSGYRIKVSQSTNFRLLSVLLATLEYQPC